MRVLRLAILAREDAALVIRASIHTKLLFLDDCDESLFLIIYMYCTLETMERVCHW